eukprot:15344307-Ditylum_brightwellii.AAC.1
MSDDNSKVCPTCPICKCEVNKINDTFLIFESPANENNTQSFTAEQAIANITRTMPGYARNTEPEIEHRNAHCANNRQHNNHDHYISNDGKLKIKFCGNNNDDNKISIS